MYHYLTYYIIPALTPIFIISILLGGNWMWLGFGILVTIFIIGDAILGEDTAQPDYKHAWIIEVPLHLALPMLTILLVAFAWSAGSGSLDLFGIGTTLGNLLPYDFLVVRSENTLFHYLGGIISVGFLIAGYGTNVAHELVHRVNNKMSMLEGRWLLSTSCNPDFAIEHVFGHHSTVGTKEDPATAKRGDNVYFFFLRSTVLGHISAWKIELNRIRKKNISIFSIRNRMITGYLMSFVWIFLFYHAGGLTGLVLFFSQAILAKFILEIINYMEHYGLSRQVGSPIKPEHSWNTNKRISSIFLFSLTRHSAHHEKPKDTFWILDPNLPAPDLPYGYLTNLFLCLVPPLWFKVMSPKLKDWDLNYR